MSDHDDLLDPFPCPRCGSTVQERFWGPCQSCRTELVAAHQGPAPDAAGDDAGDEAAGAGSARFEPAMHVVPNHVATKD